MARKRRYDTARYADALSRVGGVATPASPAARWFGGSFVPAPQAVSVAVEVERVGPTWVPVVVLGVDAATTTPADVPRIEATLRTAEWLPDGAPAATAPPTSTALRWRVRREQLPRLETCKWAPADLVGPARPGHFVSTVRASTRASGVGAAVFGSGTLGGWVLVDGQRIALVSCGHALALDPKDANDCASRNDLVVWPGMQMNPASVGPRYRDFAVARLTRWTDGRDPIDAVFAELLDPTTARIDLPADARLQPRSLAEAAADDDVWFLGATCAAPRQATVVAVGVAARVYETGQVVEGLVRYGARDAQGRWRSVTSPGDSGAWLIGEDGRACAMHKMASRCVADPETTPCDASSASYSYAQPLGRVLAALAQPRNLDERGATSGLRLAPASVDLVTPDLFQRLFPGRANGRAPAPPVVPPGVPPVQTPVTYQFNFGSAPCHCGGATPSTAAPAVTTREAAQAAVARDGNQGFPRFSRFRLANGDTAKPSGRKVTSGTATPARPTPADTGGQPALGSGTPVPLPATPDRTAILLTDAALGYAAANLVPSQVMVSITHEKTGSAGVDTRTTDFMIDLDWYFEDDLQWFITEVDVEIVRIAPQLVRFDYRVSYTVDGGSGVEFRELIGQVMQPVA